MNATISRSAEITLRKQIERCVRPVRAGRDRKLAMREELFAHLTAIYVDELNQHSDEQAAMTGALQRFGEPAALTAELNASVGLWQRYAYYEDFLPTASARTAMSLWSGSLSAFLWRGE